MENVMMDTMYHAPSDEDLKYCRITKEAVLGKEVPVTDQLEDKTASA